MKKQDLGSNPDKLHKTLMEIGELSGCHQLPERSFFIKGKQFPVCARCTGAFLGYFIGLLAAPFVIVPFWVSLLLCFVMFVDWFIQRIGILPSTNIRRLITGVLCGFGLMHFMIFFLRYIVLP